MRSEHMCQHVKSNITEDPCGKYRSQARRTMGLVFIIFATVLCAIAITRSILWLDNLSRQQILYTTSLGIRESATFFTSIASVSKKPSNWTAYVTSDEILTNEVLNGTTHRRRNLTNATRFISTSKHSKNWSCHILDQLGYCVYWGSLCVDQNRQLFLLSDDTSLHGKSVSLQNDLGPGPWHFPAFPRVYGHHDVPYRSFFSLAKYASKSSWKSVPVRKGWSLVASFDADNYNLYHWMNKLQASFVARLYELGGLKDISLQTGVLLDRLQQPDTEIDFAFHFRPPPTSWQQNYAEICLGRKTKFFHAPELRGMLPVCFQNAIVPGAALHLADGISSSMLFRELAALIKGIRVPVQERNVITLFDRSQGNRLLVNKNEFGEALKKAAPMFQVETVNWDASVPFQRQAMHMARTRIMITTHGSVLNHATFMEPSSVVVEVNGYQFHYPLDQQIVLFRGMHYIRYEESLENTQHQGMSWGSDPYPGWSTRRCMENTDCSLKRRDSNIRVNLPNFLVIFQHCLSLVV
jgi:hypothetical protein